MKTSPKPGQLRRWREASIGPDRGRAGAVFIVIGPDDLKEMTRPGLEYFVVLMNGTRRSFTRSLIEEWSVAISEDG